MSMKKFLVTLLVCMTALTSFAQLTVQPKQREEQKPNFKVIYQCKMNLGEIRYSPEFHIYCFCGVTSNEYETTCATILLGSDKESAIASLTDLENIRDTISKGNELMVQDIFGELNTTLFKVVSLAFKTEGVEGISYALGTGYINFNKARQAIADFDEKAER